MLSLLLAANLALLPGCRPSHSSQPPATASTTTMPQDEHPSTIPTKTPSIPTEPTVPTSPDIVAPVPELVIVNGPHAISSLVTGYDWTVFVNETAENFVQDHADPLTHAIFPMLPHLAGDGIATTLQFESEPDSITVRCWPIEQQGNESAYDQFQIATVVNQQIQLKEGTYIYEVEALWYVNADGYGSTYYAFTASCNSTSPAIDKMLTLSSGQQTVNNAWECMVQLQLFDDANQTWLYNYGLSGFETLLWNLSIVEIPEITLTDSLQLHLGENGKLEKINVYKRLINDEIALEMVNVSPSNLRELSEGAYYLVIFVNWQGRYIQQKDTFERCQSEYLVALNVPDKGEPKLQWEFDSQTGTLTVYGIEIIPDFTEHTKNDPPWVAVREQIRHIVVADGTKRIGDFTFYSLESLQTVSLPDGLEEIGQYAFCDAAALSSISFPDSLKRIGRGAFTRCTALQSLTFPTAIESVEHWAFAECHGVQEVTVHGSPSVINSAFNGCENLQIIRFCGSLPQNAYYSLEPYADYIVYYPGQNSSWTDAFFADQNYTILWAASHDPASEIPHNNATSGPCGRLVKWSLVDGVLTISGSGQWNHTPWLKYADLIHKVVLSPGLTNIAGSAFYGCANLEEITIPDTVVSIDSYSFYGCSALKTINLPNALHYLGDATFYGCSSLKSIRIPDGVAMIGDYTFQDCTALESITLPSSLAEIGNSGFNGCKALTEIHFPATLIRLGDSCFQNCIGLKKLYFYGNPPRVSNFTFKNVTATAYYPAENSQWTSNGMGFHSGNITEKPDPNLANNP